MNRATYPGPIPLSSSDDPAITGNDTADTNDYPLPVTISGYRCLK
jgi:hypothetical protein